MRLDGRAGNTADMSPANQPGETLASAPESDNQVQQESMIRGRVNNRLIVITTDAKLVYVFAHTRVWQRRVGSRVPGALYMRLCAPMCRVRALTGYSRGPSEAPHNGCATCL